MIFVKNYLSIYFTKLSQKLTFYKFICVFVTRILWIDRLNPTFHELLFFTIKVDNFEHYLVTLAL